LQWGGGGRRYEERSVSMFVCVLRERWVNVCVFMFLYMEKEKLSNLIERHRKT